MTRPAESRVGGSSPVETRGLDGWLSSTESGLQTCWVGIPVRGGPDHISGRDRIARPDSSIIPHMGRVFPLWTMDGEVVLVQRCRRRDVLAAWRSSTPRPPLRILAAALAHPGFDAATSGDDLPPDGGDREPRRPILPDDAGSEAIDPPSAAAA